MPKRFEIAQTIRRMAPRHPATAAVFKDFQQIACGVLTNVSVTGACIVTDSCLAPASEVDLKLSFYLQLSSYQQPRLYEVAARVVWSRRAGALEKDFEGLTLHGVRFSFYSALQKSRLHALLASKDFVDVFRLSETEFNFFVKAPVVDLDELVQQESTRPRARLL